MIKEKRVGGIAQVIEHLLSKHETMNSKHSTTNENKNK
jgi:hypothetical protein